MSRSRSSDFPRFNEFTLLFGSLLSSAAFNSLANRRNRPDACRVVASHFSMALRWLVLVALLTMLLTLGRTHTTHRGKFSRLLPHVELSLASSLLSTAVIGCVLVRNLKFPGGTFLITA